MDLPRVRGTLLTTRSGRAVVTVRCPECGVVHRYDEGRLAEPDVQAWLHRGFVDEWMPCRLDLPGNFYRVVVSPPAAARHAGGRPPPPEPTDGRAPRSRLRRPRRREPSRVAGCDGRDTAPHREPARRYPSRPARPPRPEPHRGREQ